MNYAVIAAFVAAVLFIVRHLMAQARVDQIVNSLPKDKEAAEQFQSELEKLNQEIQNADIAYSNAKRNAQQPTPPSK